MHIINKQMIALVMGLLNADIPENYYYHNYAHTQNVIDNAILIAKAENCNPSELKLITTAALWHDTGYIKVYNGHEKASCELVKKYLPSFQYSAKEIFQIEGMIMATKIPQSPKNKLEQILADADLAYLGQENAAVLANKLFRELHEINPELTKEMWNITEIDFLQNHQYFTNYCKIHTQPGKSSYLNTLITQ